MCGGTLFGLRRQSRLLGLSPRVRGNRSSRNEVLDGVGSIPACAGEPGRTTGVMLIGGVYPRVCGGTDLVWASPPCQAGLSPRVRGNLPDGAVVVELAGSIPACAGEPPYQAVVKSAR